MISDGLLTTGVVVIRPTKPIASAIPVDGLAAEFVAAIINPQRVTR